MSGVDAGNLQPDLVNDPVEFIRLMRRLKERSGCTYRQLEKRAASRGEVLPRSTIADTLRRSTLPRPEVVAAFVRACGAQAEVDAWLAARYRLAADVAALAGEASAEPDGAGHGEEATAELARRAAEADDTTVSAISASPRPTGSWWRRLLVPVASGVAAALAAGIWLWPSRQDESPNPLVSGEGAASPEATRLAVPQVGWVRIRPARTNELCITDGYERAGRYASEVAVQRSCAQAEPPRTLLEPVRDDLYYIKWEHPQKGVGCLTVLVQGPAKDLLEPWEDCRADRGFQLFRVEPVGRHSPARFRMRPAHADLCLGIRDDSRDAGAEVVLEPCTGGEDQEFLIGVATASGVPGAA